MTDLIKITSHVPPTDPYVGIHLRMHPLIKKKGEAAAKASGLNFSEWIRKAMVEKIERERK